MILADTSVWIDHQRKGVPFLAAALEDGQLLVHPFVTGEIACGRMRNRREVLRLFGELPQAPIVSEQEALHFIERRSLMGRGIGYIDIHLLASTLLAGTTRLWTRDERLAAVAEELGVKFVEKRLAET
jgi:predicted nucleic acid-binding protein